MKRARNPPLEWVPVPDDEINLCHAAAAYDALAMSRGADDEGEAARRASRVFPLREFNNTVKRTLIRDAVTLLRSGGWKPPPTILELCVGQGGDIHKWFNAGAGRVIGCDVSSASIDRARIRSTQYGPAVTLFVADLTDPSIHLLEMLRDATPSVQIVSCQMALHYLYTDPAVGARLLSEIASVLVPGGVLALTLPSAETIIRRLRSGVALSNEFYAIRDTGSSSSSSGGGATTTPRSYEFWLQDCVGTRERGLLEYLVPYPDIMAAAKMAGLECVTRAGFARAEGFEMLAPPFQEIATLYQTLLFMRVAH